MSTDYRLLRKVPACDLFDGRLEEFGVREHIKPDETTEGRRCLSDGRNYLWVYIDDDGLVEDLSRYGWNAPGKILSALADVFDTDIVSEHEPQFWGFDTEEEWDAYMEEMSKKSDEASLVELVKYLRGEKHSFKRGTLGMAWAQNVKKFFKKDPTLILPENHDKLLKLWKDSHHTTDVVVTLSPQDIALVDMIATHEDDMPSA